MNKQTPPSIKFLYGTAWKKEDTADLVVEALESGFRAIDTAAQPRHYNEALVGEGIRKYKANNPSLKREEIFIQTKFSRHSSQDQETAPYDFDAPIPEQVQASIASSLWNLRFESGPGTEEAYLDCVILHSPYPDPADTVLAWKTMSAYVPHHIRSLGISNLSLETLLALYKEVHVKPAYVQNRFYLETAFESPMRRFCFEKGIVFQAHRVLKRSNEALVQGEIVGQVSKLLVVEREVATYLLVLGLGVTIVNGTKSKGHMKADMAGLVTWNAWIPKEDNVAVWEDLMGKFRTSLGENNDP